MKVCFKDNIFTNLFNICVCVLPKARQSAIEKRQLSIICNSCSRGLCYLFEEARKSYVILKWKMTTDDLSCESTD